MLTDPAIDQVGDAVLLGQGRQPAADPLPAVPHGALGCVQQGGNGLVGVTLGRQAGDAVIVASWWMVPRLRA